MDAKFLKKDGKIKCVVTGTPKFYGAKALLAGIEYDELYNVHEPFDPYSHVYLFPEDILLEEKGFTYLPENVYIPLTEITEREEDVLFDFDSGFRVESEEEKFLCDGAKYVLYHIKDKNNDPVEAFAFICDPEKVSFYAGTAKDGYESANSLDTVEGQAWAAIKNGVKVIGATNADFFDMFGDGHPSGMCAKNGKIIYRGPEDRPFFALKKDGKYVISCDETDVLHAVGGYYILLKDGKFGDLAVYEPFGCKRHPRTAVGICPDGKFIILVVDGRIPAHSNGATLLDLALFFKKLGATEALNLDGGGSSTFLVKNGNVFDLLNIPADLVRPTEKLIRPIFNSVLVVEK